MCAKANIICPIFSVYTPMQSETQYQDKIGSKLNFLK